MSHRIQRCLLWLALAGACGMVIWVELEAAQHANDPIPLPPTPPAPSEVPSAAASGSPAPVWQGVLSLDGLQGDWVGERGPAVQDSGVVDPAGATLRLDPMEGGTRWTMYESVGQLEMHCRVVNETHHGGGFPASCDGKTHVFRFSLSSDGRLSIDNFAVVLRRP